MRELPPPSALLEKWVWTHHDFRTMGWHDASLHGFAVVAQPPEVLLDIDYILKWVLPLEPGGYFDFWVAPATLVFRHAHEIDFVSNPCVRSMEGIPGVPQLNALTRRRSRRVSDRGVDYWFWAAGDDYGTAFSLRGSGYTQYFRQEPILTGGPQTLTLEQRGGLSFARGWSGCSRGL